MRVYFRLHRGGLKESLQTEKVFNSFEELSSFLNNDIRYKNKIIIDYYCYDDRCGIGTTFIVTDGHYSMKNYGGVIGFAYLRDYETLL